MSTILAPEMHETWEAPDKLFTKTIISKGYGFHTPQDDSVCKIKVLLDEGKALEGMDCEQVKEFRIGDVDEPVDRVIESCVRTMKEEEVCDLTFYHPSFHAQLNSVHLICKDSDTSEKLIEDKPCDKSLLCDQPNDQANENQSDAKSESTEHTCDDNGSTTIEVCEDKVINEADTSLSDQQAKEETDESTVAKNEKDAASVKVQVQLLCYSREPEIWEMSITEKWRRANYHKEKGMILYARGEYQWAFRRFGLALKYLISLEHDVPSGHEEGMNMVGLKLSCYLNVAACQIRHYNFESVVKNCTKALRLQPNNAKALYRRGAAFIQLQEYEKAKEDLSKAQILEPKNPAIAKQQQLLKAQVQKLNQYYATAMKKMFS